MNFTKLMAESQHAYLTGDYHQAFGLRMQAYGEAPDGMARGRAARDIAASLDRLGDTDSATYWAASAFDFHNEAVEHDIKDGLRERAASSMYVGSLALRQSVVSELQRTLDTKKSEEALLYMRGAMSDIQQYETGKLIDQYHINMTGRAAMAEGLYGERARAFKLGAKAVLLAPLSESRMTPTFRLDMSWKDKLHARFNALVRGTAALAATALSHGPFRRLGLKIVQKTL